MEILYTRIIRCVKEVFIFLFVFLFIFQVCPSSQANAQDNPPGVFEILQQKLNQDFIEPPRVIESKVVGNYAFGTIMKVINGELQEGEGLSFLGIWENEKWSVYYQGSREFVELIIELPDELVSQEIKLYIAEESKNVNWEDDSEPLLVTGYRLPWSCGTSMYVRQDWDSHVAGVALDIDMNLNTIITAAVSGTVYDVKEDSTACGCSTSNLDLGNYITIHNNQGYYDTYVHIAQWGAIPAVGDPVYQGQPIAYSYKTGMTCGSRSVCDAGTCTVQDCNVYNHLHFHVSATYNGNRLRPVFDDVGEVQIGWYTSGNCPDTTPPVSSISLTGNLSENNWYVSNVIATISASDNLSGVAYSQYNLNGGGWVTYSAPFTITVNGTNTIQYQSVDVFGNWESVKSISFNIDTVPPTNPTEITTGCSIQSDVWQNTCSDLYFTWSGASDDTSGVTSYGYDWSGGGGGVTNNLYWNPPPVSDGIYAFKIQTKDVAGNWSNWKTMFTLKYDATAPTGSIFIKDNWEVTNQALVSLTTAASDNASGVSLMRLRDMGGTWTDWLSYVSSIQWVLPPQTGQVHTVEVQYQDQAGNLSPIYSDSIYLDIYPDQPSSQNYQLIKSTFGMSATDARSSNFSLQGTLSQVSATGQSQSENYQTISGYWSWIVEQIQALINYLPMILK